MKILFSILKWVIGIVLSIAVTVGIFSIVVYAKYNINVFDIVKSLARLNEEVDIAVIAPKAATSADENSLVSKINGSIDGLIVYNEEQSVYELSTSVSSSMSQDIRLTGPETCSLLNILLNSSPVSMVVNIGGKEVDLKEYGFKVVQVDYDVKTENTTEFNIVMSIDLTKIKESLSSFPKNLIRDRLPNTLYISSTVLITKNEGTFNYDVAHVSLAVNNISGEEVENIVKVINIVAQVGGIDDFNKNLGSSFVNALIGNSQTAGFAYSLKGSGGAVDFAFEKVGDVTYYIIKA